jgi:hypothetical protein
VGHMKLGPLPATRPWKEVVRQIADGADVPQVAEATLRAAQRALGTVEGDAGFREAVYLMAELAVAGTTVDAAEHLAGIGVEIGDSGSPAEVGAAVSEALDRRMEGKGERSDWGEMARSALVSTVIEYLTSQGASLFEASRADLTGTLAPLHREKQFGEIGRRFFGTFTNEVLNYFLSKTLGAHVGQRFVTTNQLAVFKDGMRRHCDEAAVIVEKFCGQWLAKCRREHGGRVSREQAEKLGWNSVRKLQLELEERNRNNGN